MRGWMYQEAGSARDGDGGCISGMFGKDGFKREGGRELNLR